MDIPGLLEKYSLADFPAGLGGCRNDGEPHACCEYDVSVFDEKDEQDTIVEFRGETAVIHHCSLGETRSDVLVQLLGIDIIQDEQWELRMMLSRIREKRDALYRDYMKNCLIDSLFCITKSREGLRTSDLFAPCWIKCAAFYLADAILLYHAIRPSPAHSLQGLRTLGGRIGQKFSAVNECIGIERSTPVLLERMSKSTIGFSDMVEGGGRSGIIRAKGDYFMKNSLFADWYFYLGCVNRNNLVGIKRDLAKRPELIHVLKTAFDIESDRQAVLRQADVLFGAAHEILAL